MDKIAENLVKKSNQALLKSQGVGAKTYRLIYKGCPPWEIKKPQPIVVEIEKEGGIFSPVLDIGCGYGENAKFLASKGYEVCGVDFLYEVIEQAKANCQYSNLSFKVQDVLILGNEIRKYNSLIDSATFHGFSDGDRYKYITNLHQYMQHGSLLYIIGISEQEKREGGPRRLSENIIREYFTEGWVIQSIRYTKYTAHVFPGGAEALVAKISRIKRA